MEIIIEDGLPVPPTRAGTRRTGLRPRIVECLEGLDIGQNILWSEKSYDARNHVAEAASRTAKRTKRHFCIRLTDAGVRCWRIA